jgi:hypothetical protein
MAKQVIQLGTVVNDGTGDPLRTAFTKINANFTELYDEVGTTDLGNFKIQDNFLGTNNDNDGWGGSDMYFSPNGEGYAYIYIPNDTNSIDGNTLTIGNTSSTSGGIQLSVNAGSWTFNNNGDLTLPAGGDILNSEGDSVLGLADGTAPYLELTQSAFIVQDITLGSVVSFTKADNATGDEAIDDIITDVLALTRGSIRGLYNPYLENAYNNSSHESPLGTLWNADGWSGDDGSEINNYRNRTYVTLREALNGAIGENIISTELIMWDTTNNNYYTFVFSEWSENDGGGFAYDRRLIVDPNHFTKPNGGSQIDIIKANNPSGSGIGLTRGNNQGLFNYYRDEGWSNSVSPSGTTWNVDGWSDLTDITNRTYTNFYDAFDQAIGVNILGTECVMYVEDTDKYYAIKFDRWTQNNAGGGFSYSRYEIDMDQLQEGIIFADGSVQKTAYVPTTSRVKSTATNGRRIEEVTGNKTVAVTARTTATAVAATVYESNSSQTWQFDVDYTEALETLYNSETDYIMEVSADQTLWLSAYIGGNGEGTFQIILNNNNILPVEVDETVYYRITTGADPVVW